ncbi:MAG: DegT/DnrJ/EryC1/StrS family aminotransferase, partial [Eubacteriales bacterium]
MSEQPHIFLASPHMSDEGYEQQYIRQAFEKNFIAPLGENVNLLEKSVASFVGAPATVALNSGSSAIHLGLLAAGVGKGDIVLCQALTFSASAN